MLDLDNLRAVELESLKLQDLEFREMVSAGL